MIEARGLVKRYGSTIAVDNLSFDVMPGTVTAVKPQSHTLSPGLGFAVLCGYAVIALVAGGWALARRDA